MEKVKTREILKYLEEHSDISAGELARKFNKRPLSILVLLNRHGYRLVWRKVRECDQTRCGGKIKIK